METKIWSANAGKRNDAARINFGKSKSLKEKSMNGLGIYVMLNPLIISKYQDQLIWNHLKNCFLKS